MERSEKARRIQLNNFSSPQMKAFHMTWFAFFLSFFAWFGIAPMLKVVRDDLGLTTDQIVTTNMFAVASTVLMRLLIGWVCDVVGPRLAYSALLVLGSVPVMLIGLSSDYTTFLLMRVAIGAIGASFVITQYHTSIMFASNCVGTANAITAGWSNSGAGATHFLMPLLFVGMVSLAGSEAVAWRVAMVIPGVALFVIGILYFFVVQDTPEGNFRELRAAGYMPTRKQANGTFWEACADVRVWALFVIYGACFGVELLIDSKIALYLADDFGMNLAMAGLIGGLFGAMGIFARPLGGMVADRVGRRRGLRGRVMWLFLALFLEGLALMIFSQAGSAAAVVPALIVTGVFVHMCCGATYAVVPFVNKRATGSVSGIVGAGGNALAVALMFLFKHQLTGLAWSEAFLITGVFVLAVSFLAFAVRFSESAETEAESALPVFASDRAQAEAVA